jgi:hypothetical protein
MQVPESFKARMLLHGSKGKGGYVYVYKDVEGLGITKVIDRKTRRDPETYEWMADALPGQTFPTLQALAAAMEPVTPEQLAAEAAKYPTMRSEVVISTDRMQNTRCRLCGFHTSVPAVVEVTVATSWTGLSDWNMVDLCNEHRELTARPAELIAALEAEVAGRSARAEQFLAKIHAGSTPSLDDDYPF